MQINITHTHTNMQVESSLILLYSVQSSFREPCCYNILDSICMYCDDDFVTCFHALCKLFDTVKPVFRTMGLGCPGYPLTVKFQGCFTKVGLIFGPGEDK